MWSKLDCTTGGRVSEISLKPSSSELNSQHTQWVNLIQRAGLGCVLIKSSWPEWCGHFSCLGGDEETMGMMRPQGTRSCTCPPRTLCCTSSCRSMHKLTLPCKTVPWGSCTFLLMNPWVSTPIWKCLRRPRRPLPSFEEMSHLASYSGVGLAQLLSLFCIK